MLVFACVVTRLAQYMGNDAPNQLCMTDLHSAHPRLIATEFMQSIKNLCYLWELPTGHSYHSRKQYNIQSRIKMLIRICAGETWACGDDIKLQSEVAFPVNEKSGLGPRK